MERKLLLDRCVDPISDIQSIRNHAVAAYLQLMNNGTVVDDVLVGIEDIATCTERVQKWFIDHPEALNIEKRYL